jgi:glycosyltransferase involved in cell wall biosynthesis
MADRALVSVVMPVWNAERYVLEAIESVFAQTYRPLELIVVDDGSTDRSGEVVRSSEYPVRYHRQAQAGSAVARNRGVELARGRWLAFLDADDRWAPDKLLRQIAAFEQRPDVDIVFGHVRQLHQSAWDEGVRMLPSDAADLAPGYLISSMLTTREAFGRVGPLEPSYHVGDFIDWYLRASELGLRSLMLPDLVLWRRIHGANLTVRRRDYYVGYLHALRASLARRRIAGPDSAEA